jgi:predicted transcriptional regulator YdeE
MTACKQSDNMKYETKELPQFYIIGISVRTSNQNGQSQKDIGELWADFMNGKVADKIPNKVSNDIYCVYTDYENDYKGAYTTILGCKVKSLDSIPGGLMGKSISAEKYHVFTSTGKLPDCIVETWEEIWKSATDRKYIADFDVYGDKAQNTTNAEVETFVSVK